MLRREVFDRGGIEGAECLRYTGTKDDLGKEGLLIYIRFVWGKRMEGRGMGGW